MVCEAGVAYDDAAGPDKVYEHVAVPAVLDWLDVMVNRDDVVSPDVIVTDG